MQQKKLFSKNMQVNHSQLTITITEDTLIIGALFFKTKIPLSDIRFIGIHEKKFLKRVFIIVGTDEKARLIGSTLNPFSPGDQKEITMEFYNTLLVQIRRVNPNWASDPNYKIDKWDLKTGP
jgi:hypothetical protein